MESSPVANLGFFFVFCFLLLTNQNRAWESDGFLTILCYVLLLAKNAAQFALTSR